MWQADNVANMYHPPDNAAATASQATNMIMREQLLNNAALA